MNQKYTNLLIVIGWDLYPGGHIKSCLALIEILVKDGAPIEFDQPLMLISPD